MSNHLISYLRKELHENFNEFNGQESLLLKGMKIIQEADTLVTSMEDISRNKWQTQVVKVMT